MEEETKIEKGEEKEVTVTVIEGKRSSDLHSAVAVALWLCGIHLNWIVALSAFVFFPVYKAIMAVSLFYVLLVGLPLLVEGNLVQALARYICKHACGYFPITFHVEDYQAFDVSRAYVYGYEPHSVMPLGVVGLTKNSGNISFSKISILAANSIFYTPIIRHIWALMGMTAATSKNFKSQLASGHSCLIIPGGNAESFYTQHDREVIFLKNRKGFVRIAIEMGSPLVPVFCFGQTKAYNWWLPPGNLGMKCCRFIKFVPILLWGKFGSPLPIRHPMHVIIGRPIEVKKNPTPTMDEVNEVHGIFIEAMEELFERHKARVGYPHLRLEVL